MLIKPADDRTPDLEALRALALRPDATPEVRAKIDREIRNIQSGVRGESDAAYQMDFYFRESKNWMIVHDLRLECGHRVAQIDHLLINRFLQIYVCESKSVIEGVSINELGEFVTFFRGQPRGIPSPIEQNRRHATVLEAVFKTGQVAPPRRLGFTLTPVLFSLVLVSTNARISRPKVNLPGLDTIIKSDQLKARVERDIDADNNALQLAKMVGPDKLQEFAERLAEEHRPIAYNWAAKFDLPARPPIVTQTPPAARPVAASPIATANGVPGSAPTGVVDERNSKLDCAACGRRVTYNVAKFCWFNRPRFGGNVYCMDCQKNVPTPA